MSHCFPSHIRLVRSLLAACAFLLVTLSARAQAPGWAGVVSGSFQATGTSFINAVAADASGNVFVTGTFTGQVYFGTTLLTSQGDYDLFVAKYVSGTNTWAWAASGGGTGTDYGNCIAVNGTSVYVTGQFTNTSSNGNSVLFGGGEGATTVSGTSSVASFDLLLAKYTDNGSSATLGWTQVGGGTGYDVGRGVAVSGASVYVLGSITNSTSNGQAVLFGGTGSTPGARQVNGASSTAGFDMVLAKYTDNGSTGTLGWTQVAGGTNSDRGSAVAVSGSRVYVTGYLYNDTFDTYGVVFGGTGTTPGTARQYGATTAGSPDLVLAKYTDDGSSATFGWSQVGGGDGTDGGRSVAVSGNSVYVAGTTYNNASNGYRVVFGGAGATPGTVRVNGANASTSASADLLLAKYTDNGSSATLGWTQVGGGAGDDQGNGLAVSGSTIYVTGYLHNSTSNAREVLFGGGGTTPGTVPVGGASGTVSYDLVLARYTDNGSSAAFGWAQVGGGTGYDGGEGVAVSGQYVLAGGAATPSASFGSYTMATPVGNNTSVLARVVDASLTALAMQPAGAGSGGLLLYPNPASGTTLLTGAAPGAAVQVLDALGRQVATATADASGTARLSWSAGLAAGIYVVRGGGQALRLAVE